MSTGQISIGHNVPITLENQGVSIAPSCTGNSCSVVPNTGNAFRLTHVSIDAQGNITPILNQNVPDRQRILRTGEPFTLSIMYTGTILYLQRDPTADNAPVIFSPVLSTLAVWIFTVPDNFSGSRSIVIVPGLPYWIRNIVPDTSTGLQRFYLLHYANQSLIATSWPVNVRGEGGPPLLREGREYLLVVRLAPTGNIDIWNIGYVWLIVFMILIVIGGAIAIVVLLGLDAIRS